jgi:hypothetical protein
MLSTTFVRNISQSKKNWAMCDRKCVLVLRKVPIFWSDSNKTWIFSIHFLKNTQISNLMKIRPVGGKLFRANGQTDWRTERGQQSFLTILQTRLKMNNSHFLEYGSMYCAKKYFTTVSFQILASNVTTFPSQYSKIHVTHLLNSLLRMKCLEWNWFLGHQFHSNPDKSQLTLHARNIPRVVCAEPPEDEQLILKTCRGTQFLINWTERASCWFYYTDILRCTLSRTLPFHVIQRYFR